MQKAQKPADLHRAAIGPKGAAVVTPYHREPLEWLERCHRSCLEQRGGWTLRHVMVADGHPRDEVDAWEVEHIRLPRAHADNGNTPRCLGAISAINQGYWPILFLDADNWYQPWHLDCVVALRHRHPVADVLAMGRQCVLPDGTPIPGLPDEDLEHRHVDTSCYVFYPSAFRALPLWGMMPPALGPVCDRFMLGSLHELGLVIAGTHHPSVVFTTHYSWGYQALGQPVPDDVHDVDWKRVNAGFDPVEVFGRTGLSVQITRTSVDAPLQASSQGSSVSGPPLDVATTMPPMITSRPTACHLL